MNVFYYFVQQQHTLPQILHTEVTTVVTRSTTEVTTQVMALMMQHILALLHLSHFKCRRD